MTNNNTTINDIIDAYAAQLEYSDSKVYRISLDELSSEEIEALKNIEHKHYNFNLVTGSYIEMTEKPEQTAYEKAAAENGAYEVDGKEYALTEYQAYFESDWIGSDNCGNLIFHNYYTCPAIDREGNTYMINWEIDPDYDPECLDETLACDWDNPSSVKLIDRAKW